MARVLLVNTNTERSPIPVPPVGLCLLAGALSEKFQVKVYDGLADKGEGLLRVVNDFSPDFIGLSIRNIDNLVFHNSRFYLEDVLRNFVQPLKNIPGTILIGGGSGFSVMPAELMDYFGFDYGLVGEAELSFPLLLSNLIEHKDISDIPGLILPGSKTVNAFTGSMRAGYMTPRFSRIFDFIDFEPYRQRGAYPIQTKRGCIHNCLYCTYPVVEGNTFRKRPAVETVDEIEDAQQHLGDILFEIVDSTFNDPCAHAELLCEEIIQRKLKVRLRTMGINPANASPRLFSLMHQAGFTQIDSTPDSASPTVLSNLKKNFTLQQLQDNARFLKESNLPVMWFFVFGGPGETEHTIAETFEFIDAYVCHDDMVHISTGLRIFPKTGLHEVAIREGIITPEASLLYPTFYVTRNMTAERLMEILRTYTATRFNCILSTESTPSPEMLQRAMEIRAREKLTEPMFRTLMRVRREELSGKNE
jgi:hypothetical protein